MKTNACFVMTLLGTYLVIGSMVFISSIKACLSGFLIIVCAAALSTCFHAPYPPRTRSCFSLYDKYGDPLKCFTIILFDTEQSDSNNA